MVGLTLDSKNKDISTHKGRRPTKSEYRKNLITSTPCPVPRKWKNRGYNDYNYNDEDYQIDDYYDNDYNYCYEDLDYRSNLEDLCLPCHEEEDMSEERSRKPSERSTESDFLLHNTFNYLFSDIVRFKLQNDPFNKHILCNSIKFCAGYYIDYYEPINNINPSHFNNLFNDFTSKQNIDQNNLYSKQIPDIKNKYDSKKKYVY